MNVSDDSVNLQENATQVRGVKALLEIRADASPLQERVMLPMVVSRRRVVFFHANLRRVSRHSSPNMTARTRQTWNRTCALSSSIGELIQTSCSDRRREDSVRRLSGSGPACAGRGGWRKGAAQCESGARRGGVFLPRQLRRARIHSTKPPCPLHFNRAGDDWDSLHA